MNRPVVVGEVTGVFGVSGWIKIRSFTRPEENLFSYAPWRCGDREVVLIDGRRHGPGWIAKLEGIDDRDAAAVLVRQQISVPRAALPPTEADEFYWSDLVGLKVVNTDGVTLGHVSEMFETGAHDVMAVDDGVHQRLIPFVRGHIVHAVELEAGTITVEWPDDAI